MAATRTWWGPLLLLILLPLILGSVCRAGVHLQVYIEVGATMATMCDWNIVCRCAVGLCEGESS